MIGKGPYYSNSTKLMAWRDPGDADGGIFDLHSQSRATLEAERQQINVLQRDRDRIDGSVVMRRVRAMGIQDRPIAPASPLQNAFAERLIGSIRRECVDHVPVLGEAHLRRVLKSYADHHHNCTTHRSLNKDASVCRPVQRIGSIKSQAVLGGLHPDRPHLLHRKLMKSGLPSLASCPTTIMSVPQSRHAGSSPVSKG
jgi:Integrase core domain